MRPTPAARRSTTTVDPKALTPPILPRAGGRGLRDLAEADQIGHQLVGADRSIRQLAPQPEAQINPPPLPEPRFDKRPTFHPRVEFERILELDEVGVLRVLFAEE